ncbi:alpha amylase C-terminal domain-containing protein [Streptomyces sp. NPDC055059]|uniref:alpha amylase C-terminal domain-containing protein n=1 Tax=Streptomyces sp. NPDC127172 TaxID=3345382 RepID=UPI00363552CF
MRAAAPRECRGSAGVLGWSEVLNTDAARYGGVVNSGVLKPDPEPSHGRPVSLRLTVPPLATVWLRPA